ncbi:Hypothetical predicted protein [Mytilus galloprovincialis]|uniref:Uncharacterized protein n=1 Tax=Mytilus galloprovincialis TaxID=29158 RepID=A0A8B6D020_MYTGA|nr:Hypothetical predicted protein [Mytilus galloprovincialis]
MPCRYNSRRLENLAVHRRHLNPSEGTGSGFVEGSLTNTDLRKRLWTRETPSYIGESVNDEADIIYDETPSLRMFITKNGGFQTLKRQLAQRFGPVKFEDDDDGKLVLLRVIEIQEGVNRLLAEKILMDRL